MIGLTAANARAAAKRVASLVEHTPLIRSPSFSEELGADIRFKLENRQTTGSFKLRGASNRLLTLSREQRERGCVAASSGNHGAAVACASQKLGIDCIVFVPEQTSPAKVDKIRHFGGDVRYFGTDGLDTEEHARAFAAEHGKFYLSPYNDEEVVAGQGTCGVEIVESLPDLDAIFVAVGGGGLVGGVGSVLKEHDSSIRVHGCQPLASPVMARSIEAGRILDLPSGPTLSDGTAGGVEQGSVTFPLNQAVVDDWIVVDEAAIADAMRRYMDSEGDIIEGAAGVAVAGLLERRREVAGKTVVVLVCGGNVADETLRKVRKC
ncbi:MAG: threonine/serine dehydratase [Woeseiaceae bacterium]|nr:threonine/serine dehydratase [Woeseiaceae bacterium]